MSGDPSGVEMLLACWWTEDGSHPVVPPVTGEAAAQTFVCGDGVAGGQRVGCRDVG